MVIEIAFRILDGQSLYFITIYGSFRIPIGITTRSWLLYCDTDNFCVAVSSTGFLFIALPFSVAFYYLKCLHIWKKRAYKLLNLIFWIRYMPMETLLRVLEVWSIHLEGMNEVLSLLILWWQRVWWKNYKSCNEKLYCVSSTHFGQVYLLSKYWVPDHQFSFSWLFVWNQNKYSENGTCYLVRLSMFFVVKLAESPFDSQAPVLPTYLKIRKCLPLLMIVFWQNKVEILQIYNLGL
jgi:hypothetical protein